MTDRIVCARRSSAQPVTERWPRPRAGEEQKKPSEYLKQLIAEAGASQIVLGTDYPYGMQNRNAVAHVLSVPGLTDEQREASLGGMLAKLLKLDNA